MTSSTKRSVTAEGEELIVPVIAETKSHPVHQNAPFVSNELSEMRSDDGDGETEEERRRREEEESIELARALMAEEAMASYEQHFVIMRESVDQLSQDDYAVWQAALRQEELEQEDANLEEGGDDEFSYDAMLQLGERIGDVKTERWSMIAKKEIDKLPTSLFDLTAVVSKDKDAPECKCLVCQCEYEEGDLCRHLPCSHVFHKDCVDQWLLTKDICPYCRKNIVSD